MIGYVILLGFWVLATLTLFAVSVPSMRNKKTKLVVSLMTALLSTAVYTTYAASLEKTWWIWLIIVIGLFCSTALSTYVEQRESPQEEEPQRMVK